MPENKNQNEFWIGARLLAAYSPRSTVVTAWKAALKKDTYSVLAKRVADYLPILERQVEEDKRLDRTTIADPDQLPLASRIDYYVKRLEDVHGVQQNEDGYCHAISLAVRDGATNVSAGSETVASDSLVRIGRPAVETLIHHLNDVRLTRTFTYHNGYFRILRVQDVAIECIDCITKGHLFRHQGSDDYFSSEPMDRQIEMVREITAWWQTENRTLVDRYKDRLIRLTTAKSDIASRLDLIRQIEKIAPNAINSVSLIKSWANEQPGDNGLTRTIVRELADRGDFSLLPKIRQMFLQENDDGSPSYCIYLMLKYGDHADYAKISLRAARDIAAAGNDHHHLRFAWQVLGFGPGQAIPNTDEVSDPRMIPILVGLLRFRAASGGIGNSTTITLADEAIQSLIYLTSHNEGYRYDLPEPDRFAAIDQWAKWWRDTGSHQTIKKRELGK